MTQTKLQRFASSHQCRNEDPGEKTELRVNSQINVAASSTMTQMFKKDKCISKQVFDNSGSCY